MPLPHERQSVIGAYPRRLRNSSACSPSASVCFMASSTGGDSRKALAGYYQGLASIQRNGLYPSTIAYVTGVVALRHRFR